METELKTLARLLASKKKMTLQEISQTLGLSRRQTVYRIEKINAVLIGEHQQPIQPDAVLSLDEDVRRKLLSLSGGQQSVQTTELTRQQRLLVLFLLLYCESSHLALTDLMEEMQTSRNTVLADLRELSRLLQNEEVSIASSRQQGYYLEGTEHAIHRCMMQMVMDAVVVRREARVLDLFLEQHALGEFAFYSLVCQELAGRYALQFVQDRMGEFIYIFLLMRTRLANHADISPVPASVDFSGPEARFVGDLLDFTGDRLWMQSGDAARLISWILGISFGSIYEDTEDCVLIARITGKILSRFELLSGTRADNQEELFIRMYSHIRPMYYRLLYGIPIRNPYTDKAQKEYNSLFSLVSRAVHPVEKETGYVIPPDEIAFLSMHFAALYGQKQEVAAPTTRKTALVVCLNGIGSSGLLLASLTQMFPGLDFFGCSSRLEDISQYEPDLVFMASTLQEPPETGVPSISVSLVMDSQEKYMVIREVNSLLGIQAGIPTEEMILEVVRRHARICSEDRLHQELSALFQSTRLPLSVRSLRLQEMLQIDFIQTDLAALSWQEAIRLSYAPLLEAGVITDQYITHTIQTISLSGPYVIIAPGTALAHTGPQHGSLAPALGVSVFSQPVLFEGEGDEPVPVDVIFALSTGSGALQKTDHLGVMNRLMEILEDPGFPFQAHRSSPEQLYTWMCMK